MVYGIFKGICTPLLIISILLLGKKEETYIWSGYNAQLVLGTYWKRLVCFQKQIVFYNFVGKNSKKIG
jgi:hypothetical protein